MYIYLQAINEWMVEDSMLHNIYCDPDKKDSWKHVYFVCTYALERRKKDQQNLQRMPLYDI